MAEDDDNLVLRLLREIRSEQAGERSTMQAIEGGITTIERHMEDVKDETTGQRAIRNEADTELPQERQYFLFHSARQQ